MKGVEHRNEASDINEPDSSTDVSLQQHNHRRSLRKQIMPVILLTLAVICTLLLARWQWDRFNSASGTFQNLGYALQWPVFGIFCVVIYRKYLKYEREMEEEGELLSQKFDDTQREVPADFLPPIAGKARGSAGQPLPAPSVGTDDSPRRRRYERRDDGLDRLREKQQRSQH